SDTFFFKVQRNAVNTVRELEHLARHRLFDAMDARDAVTNGDDRADFRDVNIDRIAPDLIANDFGDFFRFNVHAVLVTSSVTCLLFSLRLAPHPRALPLRAFALAAAEGPRSLSARVVFAFYLCASAVSASFIFCNWRVTLPSYTVLPTRAIAPPIIDGSTRLS